MKVEGYTVTIKEIHLQDDKYNLPAEAVRAKFTFTKGKEVYTTFQMCINGLDKVDLKKCLRLAKKR